MQCDECGNWVQDHRDLERDGKTLCIPCAEGAYFERL
ncbi:MAG: TraR/DksA C4-type zinc finger protein [Actinomycetota bacterium]